MAMENPLKNGCVNGNSGKTIYTDIYLYIHSTWDILHGYVWLPHGI